MKRLTSVRDSTSERVGQGLPCVRSRPSGRFVASALRASQRRQKTNLAMVIGCTQFGVSLALDYLPLENEAVAESAELPHPVSG